MDASACLEGNQLETARRKRGQDLLCGGGEVTRQEVQITMFCSPRVELGDGLRNDSAPNFDTQMIPTPTLRPATEKQENE